MLRGKITDLRKEIRKEITAKKEAWNTYEEELCVKNEYLKFEKVAFDFAVEVKKKMKGVVEATHKVIQDELNDAKIQIHKQYLTIDELKSKIHTTVVDFKNSESFKRHIESKRHQWITYFIENPVYKVEKDQAIIKGANRVLEELRAFYLNWIFSQKSSVDYLKSIVLDL